MVWFVLMSTISTYWSPADNAQGPVETQMLLAPISLFNIHISSAKLICLELCFIRWFKLLSIRPWIHLSPCTIQQSLDSCLVWKCCIFQNSVSWQKVWGTECQHMSWSAEGISCRRQHFICHRLETSKFAKYSNYSVRHQGGVHELEDDVEPSNSGNIIMTPPTSDERVLVPRCGVYSLLFSGHQLCAVTKWYQLPLDDSYLLSMWYYSIQFSRDCKYAHSVLSNLPSIK